MPELVCATYAAQMHDFYRKSNASQLQREQFRAEHFPEIAMTPQASHE